MSTQTPLYNAKTFNACLRVTLTNRFTFIEMPKERILVDDMHSRIKLDIVHQLLGCLYC